MPAPDHLLPILDRLGDGGTVALAETVHQMLTGARAEAVAAAISPDVAELQARLDAATAEMAHLTDVLMAEFASDGPVQVPGLEDGPGHAAVRILREQAAELDQVRAAVVELAPAPPPYVTLHTGDPNAENQVGERSPLAGGQVTFEIAGAAPVLIPTPAGHDVPDKPEDVDPEDVEPWRPFTVADPAAHPSAEDDGDIDWGDAESQRISRTGTNTTGAETPVAVTWAPAAEPQPEPSNADIRAWCVANNVPVNAKGSVRADARAAYGAAHQGG